VYYATASEAATISWLLRSKVNSGNCQQLSVASTTKGQQLQQQRCCWWWWRASTVNLLSV